MQKLHASERGKGEAMAFLSKNLARPVTASHLYSASTRILISELDSTNQRALFDRSSAKDAISQITGMLRIGMLISQNVLVTDAMLLDGTYFARLGPDRVLRELGASEARYPLVVTGTAKTLREGLENRLADPSFRWSLSDVTHGSDAPEVIKNHWEQWARYIDDGFIQYEQQTAASFSINLEGPYFDHAAPPDLVSSLTSTSHRSRAWLAIEQAELAKQDKDNLLGWWNSGYFRMIAENARADWVTFKTGSSAPSGKRRGDLQLPTRLVGWANTVSSPTVSVAWDSSRNQRERLHEKPNWSRLRDLSYTATQVGEVVSRRSVMLDATFKALIALAAIAVAIPGLELTSVSHPLTWILFLGVVISTLPYDSLIALFALLQRDQRTSLILHENDRRPTNE